MGLVTLRASAVAGALLFVAGGIVGWYPGDPEFLLPSMRAHEFAGVVGEWAWLAVAPLLAATVAPYRGRWAAWLWPTPLPALAAALIVIAIDPVSLVTFPFNPPHDPTRSPWLFVSLAGAGVTLASLVAVAVAVRRGAVDPLTGAWQLPAIAVVVVAIAAAIPIARGPRDAAMEAHLARTAARACDASATASPAPRVRVECRDRVGRGPRCAWETRCPDGSVSGGWGAAGAYYGPG